MRVLVPRRGEFAFQTVFHLHLHVIPRNAGDGWTLTHAQAEERDRLLLKATLKREGNAASSRAIPRASPDPGDARVTQAK